MQRPIAGLAAAALLACCGAPPRASADRAYVRLNAVPGRPAAAYFTLHAGTDPIVLLAVRTPAALRAELHESMAHGTAMTMAPLAQVAVPAGGAVAFAPGGRHVMLFDVNPALAPGARTTLTLALADGRAIHASARVIAAGDAAP